MSNARKRSAKKSKKPSIKSAVSKGKSQAKTGQARNLSGFTLPWMKSASKDFSSSFKFGNFSGTVESKGKTVTINVIVEGKNFDFDGVLTMNEKAFKNLQRIFGNALDNLR